MKAANQVCFSGLLNLCVYLATFSYYLRLTLAVGFFRVVPRKWRILVTQSVLAETHFLASISHTEVSLRSFWHAPPFVVAFWIYCTRVHFLGHMTRFDGNRCYGNQKK